MFFLIKGLSREFIVQIVQVILPALRLIANNTKNKKDDMLVDWLEDFFDVPHVHEVLNQKENFEPVPVPKHDFKTKY